MLGVYTQKRLVGTYPTDVRLNGDSIGTFTSTVTYGAASATTSTFTFTNTNLVAGNSYTVIILAKDTFGNDVLDSSTTFGVSFDKITATFTSSYIDTNRHNITFSVTEAVNTVNMLVRLGSIDLANSPKHINIIAADPTTAFISADTGLIATDSATGGITATLSLQDPFGNSVITGTPNVKAVIVGVNTLATTTFQSSSYTPDNNVQITNIRHNIVGAYTIRYYLNGALLTSTSSLTILPSTPWIPLFTFSNSSSYSVGGTSNYFDIQTRDMFGNARTTEFISGSAFTFTMEFNPINAETTGQLSQGIVCPTTGNCTYRSNGVYRANIFNAREAGTWQVRACGDTGCTPYTMFTVNPGETASTSIVENLNTTIVAGTIGAFMITSKDSQGNIRDHVNTDGNAFIVSIDHLLSTRFAQVQTVMSFGGGKYLVSWRPAFSGCAGKYKIKVVLSDSTEISYSNNRTVDVTPSATTQITDLSGTGLSGSAAGASVSFSFNARDVFNNLQTSVDTFTVIVLDETAANPIVATSTPIYTTSYTVPALVSSSPSYTVNVYLNTTSPGTLVQTFDAVTIASDNDPNGATAVLSTNFLNPDSPLTVAITNKDFAGTVVNSDRTFFLDFIQGGSVKNTLTPSCTVSTSVSTCTATVNSESTKHLTAKGNYTMAIRVGASSYSPHNYTIQVITGTTSSTRSRTIVNDTTIAAGKGILLMATIHDSYDNLYTEGTRNVIFKISGSCSTGCDIPGTFNSASNMYTAIYVPVKAGIYSVLGTESTIDLGTSQLFTTVASSASHTESVLGVPAGGTAGLFIVDFGMSVTVALKDAYGNAIGGLTSFPFTPSLTGNSITFTTSETSTAGTYEVSFIPTTSSVYTGASTATKLNLGVTINGNAIVNSPRLVTIEPGDISDSMSSIVGIPAIQTAGEYMVLNVTLKDKFGNPWKQNPNIFTLITTSGKEKKTSGAFSNSGESAFREPIATGNGRFTFQLKLEKANVFASYSATYTANTRGLQSAKITGILNRTYIIAATASASTTVVLKETSTDPLDASVGTNPFNVNFTSYTIIQLNDRFGNVRLGNASGEGNVTVRFDGHKFNDYIDKLDPVPFICTNNAAGYTANLASFEIAGSDMSSTVTCNQNIGQCTIKTRGIRAGVFRMLIFVNNEGAKCYEFTVNPGKVNPSGSIFQVGTTQKDGSCKQSSDTQLSDVTVGSKNCGKILMADFFGNRLKNAINETVTLGNSTDWRDCTHNIIEAGSDFNVSTATYAGNGEYRLSFLSEVIGVYSALASIGGAAVGATKSTSCVDITFNPWYVYSFRPEELVIVNTVDVPSTIKILAYDIFNNTISTGGHSFSLSISHLKQAYSITVSTSTIVYGKHQITYLPEWPGKYRGVLKLTPDSRYTTSEFPRAVNHIGQNDLSFNFNVSTKYLSCAQSGEGLVRCSNDPVTGTCVNNYTSCSGITVCSGSTPIYCEAISGCVAKIADCPCASNRTRCKNGMCAYRASECIESSLVCPYGLVNCNSSSAGYPTCVANLMDCPAKHVCPPGNTICDDGVSCASSLSLCPSSTALFKSCSTGQFKCPSGACVVSPLGCPTPKSCPASTPVQCSDGSCQIDSTSCPSQYVCYDNKMRCRDGTCVSDPADCPTMVTCALGEVLCENNQCASTLAECKAALKCSSTEIRCPDGSCAGTINQCPTPTTCDPQNPVLCSDGQCVSAYSDCPSYSSLGDCNAAYGNALLVTCPGGSCAKTFSQCPTSITCPDSLPVKCSDGSCQLNSTICTAFPSCPKTLPVTCPDNSCAGSIKDCPSSYKCPSTLPVKCSDGSCVSAESYCSTPSVLSGTCPDGWYRCPASTNCAPNRDLCPSVLSCPMVNGVLYDRCVDGTCRSSCSDLSYFGCSTSQVTCPTALTGYPSCVLNITDCPESFACPSKAPVVCADGTCVADKSLCPAWPTDFQNRVPCPDGGWALNRGLCGTAVSCPSTAPYKCHDETCRMDPADCVEPNGACPSSTPFYCRSGACRSAMFDCLTTAPCPKPDTFPLKCAVLNGTATTDQTGFQCVASSEMCDDPFFTQGSGFVQSCPNSWGRCRDSKCVRKTSDCDDLSCPIYLPHLCDSGICAANSSACPTRNGCPWDRPFKCVGGSCVSRKSQCPTASECPSGRVRCNDGSCAPNSASCPEADGCSSGAIRCNDGSCATYDPTRPDKSTNLCTNRVPGSSDQQNSCPFWQPVRCPGGVCAASEKLCYKSTFPKSYKTCPSVEVVRMSGGSAEYLTKTFPVMCTGGTCVDAEVQCPTLRECKTGTTRCGDGSCRTKGRCPTYSSCPTNLPYRCLDGACTPSREYCVSPKTVTGCPCISWTTSISTNTEVCSTEQVKCKSNVLGGLCGVGETSCGGIEDFYPRANGCNSTHSMKCWDGACERSASHCRLSNGCLASSPFKCPNGVCTNTSSVCDSNIATAGSSRCGDGKEYTDLTTCNTYSNCPITTPYRCADGSCAKYQLFDTSSGLTVAERTLISSTVLSQACSATTVCSNNAPVRCADFSCAATVEDCPPVFSCQNPNMTYICPDLTCAADVASCPSSNTVCPAASPIVCGDGSCRTNPADCKADAVVPTCADSEVLCFDGVCRASAFECISAAYTVESGKPVFTPTTVDANVGVCAAQGSVKMTVCPDGSCVPYLMKDTLCPPLPSCPASLPKRCPNSQCVASSTSCSAPVLCPSNYLLCADGTCRETCLQEKGCSGFTPYYCPATYSSESFCVPDGSACASSFVQNLDIHMLTETTSNTPPSCTSDCNRDVVVPTQTFTLNPNLPSSFVIATSSIDLTPRAELMIPAGAIGANTDGSVTFTVEMTGDDVLRGGNMYIHRSRGDFGGVSNGQFSIEQAILSPAFRCRASADPFNFGIVYTALVDNPLLINANTANKTDICLAVLKPTSQSWVCIAEFLEDRKAHPIFNASESRFIGEATGLLYTCLDSNGDQMTFAFAHVPEQATRSSGKVNDFYFVQLIVVLVVVFFAACIIVFIWAVFRVARYRGKMKKKMAENKILDDKIQDMKMYEGGLGRAGKDEEINMIANPMVVKFKSLQEQLREYKDTTGYYDQQSKVANP
ncbi:hypothetical protein AAMO2058_001384700 [Amorphochlora amoebiformis]